MSHPRCEACGLAYELHQAGTLACPSGGEAAPGEVQRWYPDLKYEPLRPRPAIFAAIDAERKRQDATWGVQDHRLVGGFHTPDGWAEIEKTFKDLCRALHEAGSLTWDVILMEEVAESFRETDEAKAREELIQVAAVAVAIIECIDRRNAKAEGAK